MQPPLAMNENSSAVDLTSLSDEELLNCRICDLPLEIENTWLKECIDSLYEELRLKGFVFRPVCYLADEWLSPHGEPVVGIPFYLAHPVLTRLERKIMLEAEGETKAACMKLLRHETGHAFLHAYHLEKRREWKEVFGPPEKEYPDTYRFHPYSRRFVRHLDGFYAERHPDEDFAETFAVWLADSVDWPTRYKGWAALKKLHYVDELMASIKDKPPLVAHGKKYWHFTKIKSTLKSFYKKKRQVQAEEFPDFHDDNLNRIFIQSPGNGEGLTPAAGLIRKNSKDLICQVALWTGEKRYVINDLLKTITGRCQTLKLAVRGTETGCLANFSSYVTTLAMNRTYTGWYRGGKNKRNI